VSSDADRDLSTLYRAGAREEPPTWLDETILSAAGSSSAQVGMRAKPNRRLRWQAPLALAAVLTFAVSLALLVEGELEQKPASRPSLPAQVAPSTSESGGQFDTESRQAPDAGFGQDRRHEPDPSPSTKAAPSATPETKALSRSPMRRTVPDDVQHEADEQLAAKRRHPATGAVPAPPGAASSSTASPSPPSQITRERSVESPTEAGIEPRSSDRGTAAGRAVERESRGNRDDRPLRSVVPDAKRERAPALGESGEVLAEPRASASSPMPSPQAPNTADQRVEPTREHADAVMTPQQWLREIEQLHRDGQEELARARLDQFRRRFPDYPLPKSLQ
jgi:hypothetical protein